MGNKKILIGSCGGLTGVYLAKCFSGMDGYDVYGADSSEISVGALFMDKHFLLPGAGDDGFIDALVELLNTQNIDYYLPTHSKEVRKIAESENELRARTNARFLVSPIETFRQLESKSQAYRSLNAAGIPTPKMYACEPDSFPVIMKGNIGSGGASVIRIDNVQVYRAYRETAKDVSFFEYIQGREYTTDCMFDADGRLLACNLRERIKTIGGAAVICRNTLDFDILPWIRKMGELWKFRGCVNFQFIVRDHIPYFTDVNLRYPSGGLPLTVESGIYVPEMMIRLLDGETIAWGEYTAKQKKITMYRYFEEAYTYDAD